MTKLRHVLAVMAIAAFVNASPTTKLSANRTMTKDFEYNGSKYHINSAGFYDRILAIEYCKDYIDMRVVDFDQGSEEFITVIDHIINNELFPNEVGYWTSGLKSPSHDNVWIWETTVQEITEFHWGANQPHNAPEDTYLCIYFSLQAGGWVDEDCFVIRLDAGVICEKKL